MLDRIPDMEELKGLVGENGFSVWTKLCAAIEEKYDMDRIWNSGGKAWKYEYKYRRGGKTLCSLYAGGDGMGFMVILGKAEREKFETQRQSFSAEVQRAYDESQTFHDGKWIMFMPKDTSMIKDFIKLLEIKRRPNRK